MTEHISMTSYFGEHYSWDSEKTSCACILINEKGQEFVGNALCHPNDYDMKSVRTGEEIAFTRAYIKMLCAIRDEEIKPIKTVLENLYKNMATSYRFNPESFEAKQLNREIKEFRELYDIYNLSIKQHRKYLKQYIDAKDEFYKKQRNNQNGGQN